MTSEVSTRVLISARRGRLIGVLIALDIFSGQSGVNTKSAMDKSRGVGTFFFFGKDYM